MYCVILGMKWTFYRCVDFYTDTLLDIKHAFVRLKSFKIVRMSSNILLKNSSRRSPTEVFLLLDEWAIKDN